MALFYPHNSNNAYYHGWRYLWPSASSTAEMDSRLEQNIEKTYFCNLEMLVVGDFNIHYLNTANKKNRLAKGLQSLNLNQQISKGNHMISSAIWDKSARVNFSKTNKIARARRASAICSLWKIYECWFIPNCTRKIMWLLVNNTHTKI